MPEWTPEMDAELTRMRANGYSSASIGKTLGVSRNAAIGRAYRLALPPPAKNPRLKWTAAAEAKLKRMRAAGHRSQDIGAALGCSAKAVQNRASTLGLPQAPNAPVGGRPAKARTAISAPTTARGKTTVTLRTQPNEPKPLKVPLATIDQCGCRWVIEERGPGGEALFCGHPASDTDLPWCPHHHARVYPPRGQKVEDAAEAAA